MKKNILQFLTIFLFFLAADGRGEEWGTQDSYYQDSYYEEDYEDRTRTGFYGKIFGGANFLQNTTIDRNKTTYKTGYVVGGSLGYCWDYGFRLEGEYAYRRNAINKIHLFGQGSSRNGYLQASSLMANLLWDFSLSSWGCACWNIQPYIGAGVGCDFQQMHATNCLVIFNQKWRHFSWQVMAGFAYPIFCNTEISLEYKFHQGGSNFDNHSIGVGFTYKFDFPTLF